MAIAKRGWRLAALVALLGVLALSALLLRLLYSPDAYVLHSASELYARYAQPGGRPGFLPADTMPIDAADASVLRSLFQDFYVVKDGSTDCSFVAALMLMMRRDPEYPLRIVHRVGDVYAVRFPALPSDVLVSRDDLREHHENWEKTRETVHRVWQGHIPKGLEILRCAYYNYQAQSGIRGSKGAVHAGGRPAQDLIVLSGVEESHALSAYCDRYSGVASFATCATLATTTRRDRDGAFSSRADGSPRQVDDPLRYLGNAAGRLLILSSNDDVPTYSQPRLVPNHAYYYLGATEAGDYVLGNSYQTRRPVVVTPAELAKYFRSVDYIDLDDRAKRAKP